MGLDLAERDAYLGTQALVQVQEIVGRVDAMAAVVAYREHLRQTLAHGSNGFAALHMLGVMDVLDGWLACTHGELLAQWVRISAEIEA